MPLLLSLVLPYAPRAAAQGRPDAVAKLPGQPASAPKFNQSAGYLTVDGRKAYFYWLVEAIGQPDSKPLLLWLNGGPGCSSVGCGLFEEVGPWRVASKAGAALLYNKYAWNRLVNIVFLESPVGVGYSYSTDSADYTTDDEQTAKDNHAFLVGFVARHPRFARREFYIAGESYAGHYIPQLAARIIEQNQIDGGTRLNLDFSGIFLGNPFVNYAHDTKGPIQFFYDHGMLSADLYNDAINVHSPPPRPSPPLSTCPSPRPPPRPSPRRSLSQPAPPVPLPCPPTPLASSPNPCIFHAAPAAAALSAPLTAVDHCSSHC
ncbi:unnamed protein product [Closterium sp. NIES-53]